MVPEVSLRFSSSLVPGCAGARRCVDESAIAGLCADAGFRCQDKKGSFTAETTAWEGTAAAELGPHDNHGTQTHALKDAMKATASNDNKSV
jgi:hypothetical protein